MYNNIRYCLAIIKANTSHYNKYKIKPCFRSNVNFQWKKSHHSFRRNLGISKLCLSKTQKFLKFVKIEPIAL